MASQGIAQERKVMVTYEPSLKALMKDRSAFCNSSTALAVEDAGNTSQLIE